MSKCKVASSVSKRSDNEQLQPFRTHNCWTNNVPTLRCLYECIPHSLAKDRVLVSAVGRVVDDAERCNKLVVELPLITVHQISTEEQCASAPAHIRITHNDRVIDHIMFKGCRFTLTHSGDDDGTVMLAAPWRLTVKDEMDASRAARKAVAQEHEAKRAHCEKLLTVDLPQALERSKAALAARRKQIKKEDTDLSELGAMLVVQDRIEEEIATQLKLEEELVASGPQLPVCDATTESDIEAATRSERSRQQGVSRLSKRQ